MALIQPTRNKDITLEELRSNYENQNYKNTQNEFEVLFVLL